jgi:FixJ family two-component response regulator
MRTVRPNLKVVFVSGYTRDIFTVGNALDGNSVFIHKPFSPDMLVTKVREMLDKTPIGGGI